MFLADAELLPTLLVCSVVPPGILLVVETCLSWAAEVALLCIRTRISEASIARFTSCSFSRIFSSCRLNSDGCVSTCGGPEEFYDFMAATEA